MSMVAALGRAIQQTFGDAVAQAALASQVVQRQRVLTAVGLAKIFLLGFLRKPAASDEDLARMAAEVGEPVSPQAIEQRHTPRLVVFLRAIFEHLATLALGSPRSMAPLLERFTKVVLIDGSTVKLPDGVQAEHPGCGGSHDSGRAALKLQTEFLYALLDRHGITFRRLGFYIRVRSIHYAIWGALTRCGSASRRAQRALRMIATPNLRIDTSKGIGSGLSKGIGSGLYFIVRFSPLRPWSKAAPGHADPVHDRAGDAAHLRSGCKL